jgi:hypothetical protein
MWPCLCSDECLNDTLFSTLTEARTAITAWKEDYNDHRPHFVERRLIRNADYMSCH